MIRSLLFFLLLLPFSVQADLQLTGDLTQGGLLRGRAEPGTRVYYGEQLLKQTAAGEFILGFGRDAAAQHSLTLIAADGQVTTRELQVTPREYRVERINGISKKMMSPSEADLRRIRQEAALVKSARSYDSEQVFFTDAFIWPLTGRISGVYGSQRIFNGEPRRPHFGIDIAAPTGTPVVAPAAGIVRLGHKGMFFSGKTLILDHGHGLSSSFLHLSQIYVQEGQKVAKGERIAAVGASGRVTGPHLDWRINWFDVRLDPAMLVPPMSQN
ncbi:Murein DD-endopeptidase MepM and murein hydrolase activator NlpD, contain LysM domain [Malonomonas rubra DSM 5091]|uniref:Murein DD-endopeptidase MepM and murein hydrolase activator NlpD, contain LysM domain n=1 Tax=Malonomonas rubra DSM 5091 TaxID=1122189 RepID=A0A1M6G8Y4_MALRU|nr:M23 family metallopeptidase [Malonomonas rubra]SHJ06372.1 Murein DD-endopeptidase MepM and murein hydrolase activator NlpD, contain LysM domain [Malonomonas rubra DSM 5091]